MTQEQIESYNRRAEIVFMGLNVTEPLPEEATTLEKCILQMRLDHLCYETIQSRLGMVPKKFIRETLKKYKPELIKIDTNNHKIPDAYHRLCGDWNWEEFKKGQNGF